ncbi:MULTISPECIES: GIY-YIG nuclease family protein [unclassified Burkholderia]|uniref:GIY-YIG nuclease family protein n=1 Tax=unclassified Burkholderia TaxID=2613784 RepID=UPI00075BCD6F|nr:MULTISPECIES: GIY-YIG nuclease family protein [unclassified Burkholderia]KUY94640.1 excinuclease ABC subunit C [Burkholderia sp. RF7-non_BP1]KUZ02079.1 excinuclease ABC subunit C [Burkholderia sp. RF7-non_BP4]
MSWFLYLIECADDSVYTGITTDVAARFDEHASGKGARYTRSRKPRAVLASFPLPDRSIASRAEYWVKRLTAAQKRELAAGIRTLESVLPAGMSIDGNVDAAVPQDGKKVKAKRADIANGPAETEEARDKAAKSGTAGKKTTSVKIAKTRRAATAPTSAKTSPVSRKRAGTADDTEGKKTAARGTPAKRDKPATNALPKRKAPAAGGKPAANGPAAPASAPARGRPSTRKATAEVVEAVTPPAAPARRATGAKRAKAAPSAGAQPAPARKKTLARATARTKQNRAAS